MPVTILVKPKGVTPSNKGGVTDEQYPLAYSYSAPGVKKVRVLEPVIDKLSVTIPVEDPEMRQTIFTSVENLFAKKKSAVHTNVYGKAKKEYAFAINVTLTGDETMLVQAGYKKPQSHFVRIEFNPAKLWKYGPGLAMHRLKEVTGNALPWSYVVEYGRATRIDAAVDMVNAPMSSLVILNNQGGKTHFYVGETGEIETSYLGIPGYKKPADQLAYNKNQEAEDKGTSPLYNNIVHTRIEMISKSKNRLLKNIAGIKENLFERLTVIHPGNAPEGIDPTLWALFLETCRFRGLEGALSLLPENLAGTCQTALMDAAANSWRPDKIWQRWSNAVSHSQLLDTD